MQFGVTKQPIKKKKEKKESEGVSRGNDWPSCTKS